MCSEWTHGREQIGMLLVFMTVSIPLRTGYLVWEVQSGVRSQANIRLRSVLTEEIHLALEWLPLAAMALMLRTIADLRSPKIIAKNLEPTDDEGRERETTVEDLTQLASALLEKQ